MPGSGVPFASSLLGAGGGARPRGLMPRDVLVAPCPVHFLGFLAQRTVRTTVGQQQIRDVPSIDFLFVSDLATDSRLA